MSLKKEKALQTPSEYVASLPKDLKNTLSITNPLGSASQFLTLELDFCLIYLAYDNTGNGSVHVDFFSSGVSYTDTIDNVGTTNFGKTHMISRNDFYEIIYVEEGSLTLYYIDGFHHIGAGEAAIINQNVFHRNEYDTSAKMVTINISAEFMNHILMEMDEPDSDHIQRLLATDESDKVIVYSSPKTTSVTEEMKELIEKIITELRCKRSGYIKICEGMIQRIISQLTESRQYTNAIYNKQSSHTENIFQKMNLLLEADCTLTAQELSNRLSYTCDYLSKVVKKCSGIGLNEFIQRFRMKKAADHLAESNVNIHELIEMTGCSNSTFYRQFCKFYGCSPVEFRKRIYR